MERVSSRRRRSPLNVGLSPESDAALVVEHDGLHLPTIKPHSLEKLRVHNRFARMFATAMHDKWPQLAYVGLYAGAGRARIDGTDKIVETSALSALRQPNAFTHYILVENDPDCLSALAARCKAAAPNANVTIISHDVNDSIPAVRAALPKWSPGNGLLTFGFVDPFNTGIRFDTIRALTDLRIDLLILLMLGVDTRRNFAKYLNDETSTRIAEFIDCPTWRAEYKKKGQPLRYVLTKFDEAMQRAGYPSARDAVHPVYADGTKVLQYMLTFYSKSPTGRDLWSKSMKSLKRLESQTTLEF